MGPDNIHPKILKSLAEHSEFVGAVGNLFRNCTALAKFQKHGRQPMLLPCIRRVPGANHLTIVLFLLHVYGILCKIYERIVRKHILNFVDDKVLPNQHGFVNKK